LDAPYGLLNQMLLHSLTYHLTNQTMSAF